MGHISPNNGESNDTKCSIEWKPRSEELAFCGIVPHAYACPRPYDSLSWTSSSSCFRNAVAGGRAGFYDVAIVMRWTCYLSGFE